jgi:hypothetical protein
MVRRAQSDSHRTSPRFVLAHDEECDSFVVRESCYRFYEPSYAEHSNGCSQEVQSFKER